MVNRALFVTCTPSFIATFYSHSPYLLFEINPSAHLFPHLSSLAFPPFACHSFTSIHNVFFLRIYSLCSSFALFTLSFCLAPSFPFNLISSCNEHHRYFKFLSTCLWFGDKLQIKTTRSCVFAWVAAVRVGCTGEPVRMISEPC